MFSELIRSLSNGFSDVKAAHVHRSFLDIVETIDGADLPSWIPETVASGFVRMTRRYIDSVRAGLPENCWNQCLHYLEPRSLRDAADHFFRDAQTMDAKADPSAKLVAISLRLLGYFLIARSWQGAPRAAPSSDSEIMNSAPLFGTRIEIRIKAFLLKHGQEMPLC